jgi:hypothetical protein
MLLPCPSIGRMRGAKLAIVVMAGQEEMFAVAMVILSSSMVLHAKRYWVGSRGAAETNIDIYLHLNLCPFPSHGQELRFVLALRAWAISCIRRSILPRTPDLEVQLVPHEGASG